MNIYHRTSKQLCDYLNKCGCDVESVGRCHIGFKNFYNLKINIHKDAYADVYEEIIYVLGVNNIGLVDFSKLGDLLHIVILIDEYELNSKYLVEGNLKFE